MLVKKLFDDRDGLSYASYDAFVAKHPQGSLFQTRKWIEYQWSAFGRAGEVFVLEEEGTILCSALALFHALPLGRYYVYLPRGPLLGDEKKANMMLLDAIRKETKKTGGIFVLMDPFYTDNTQWEGVVDIRKIQPASSRQPAATLILDLKQSESRLLGQMKEKGRYNISLAQRKGVTVREGTVGELYPLLRETAKRDGFTIHGSSVYETMLTTFERQALLLVAEHEGEVIAGGMFLFDDRTGIYYYGASASAKRNLMAPYALQWEAIKEAKKRGCKEYDFLGISPPGSGGHRLSGVTEFKMKFGGKVREYVGAKKIVMDTLWNKAYEYWQKKKIVAHDRQTEDS